MFSFILCEHLFVYVGVIEQKPLYGAERLIGKDDAQNASHQATIYKNRRLYLL